uniref:Ribonuclease P protein subunit p21 n=1 Tax=Plectus sambesii TaxID=2011161 RepID=A0A914WRI6_9BILA
MAKKGNKQQSKLHSVSSNHAHMRVNFLYQAALFLAEQNSAPAEDSGLTKVARFYTETLREVVRKAQVRLHPHMKRTMCKKCHRVFSDGPDSGFRVVLPRKGPKCMVVICLSCGTRKNFPMRRDHLLSVERQEQQFSADSQGVSLEERR